MGDTLVAAASASHFSTAVRAHLYLQGSSMRLARARRWGFVALLVNVGSFDRPMDSLPLFVFTNARQPIKAMNQQAWGAALLLLLFVLAINVLVRARTVSRGRAR